MDAGSVTPTDEYTPTTDDIRETLVEVITHEETRRLSREHGGALVSLDAEYRAEVENTARAAFGRWLAFVKAEAVREYADALAANESAQDWTRAYEFVDDAREWANDTARGGAA